MSLAIRILIMCYNLKLVQHINAILKRAAHSHMVKIALTP